MNHTNQTNQPNSVNHLEATNPYSAPKAPVRDLQPNPNDDRRLGWKILFWISLFLTVLGTYFSLEALLSGEDQLLSVMEILIYPLSLLGLFGLAYKRAFLSQRFWKSFLIILILFDISSTFYYLDTLLIDSSEATDIIMGFPLENLVMIGILVAFIPLMLLTYYGLYKYGYQRIAPWIVNS